MKKDSHFQSMDEVITLLKLIERECNNHELTKGKIVLIPFNMRGWNFIGLMGSEVFISPANMDRRIHTLRSIPVERLEDEFKVDIIYLLSSKQLYVWDPMDKQVYQRATKELKNSKKNNYIKKTFLDIMNQFLKSSSEMRSKQKNIRTNRTRGVPISDIAKKYRVNYTRKMCENCKAIPHDVHGFWCGNSDRDSGYPSEASNLEIVGAPHFTDSTSYRHWCIKKCSKCNSHYLWEFNYEFLIPASEDEIWLTRLSEIEQERWLKVVDEYIKKKKSLSRQV